LQVHQKQLVKQHQRDLQAQADTRREAERYREEFEQRCLARRDSQVDDHAVLRGCIIPVGDAPETAASAISGAAQAPHNADTPAQSTVPDRSAPQPAAPAPRSFYYYTSATHRLAPTATIIAQPIVRKKKKGRLTGRPSVMGS
jgi:hypothetical protein